MLTSKDGPAAVERVLTELNTAFPTHEFLAGDATIGGYENSILAMHGSAGGADKPGSITLPNEQNVKDVMAAFRQIVGSLKGWNPS
jgi:hypothetical protein